MVTKERGWHRCGTCQMDSDAKVSNGVIKVKSTCNRLQRITECMQRRYMKIWFLGSSDGLALVWAKALIFIPGKSVH